MTCNFRSSRTFGKGDKSKYGLDHGFAPKRRGFRPTRTSQHSLRPRLVRRNRFVQVGSVSAAENLPAPIKSGPVRKARASPGVRFNQGFRGGASLASPPPRRAGRASPKVAVPGARSSNGFIRSYRVGRSHPASRKVGQQRVPSLLQRGRDSGARPSHLSPGFSALSRNLGAR